MLIKIVKVLFVLSAVLFTAKPFIGYSVRTSVERSGDTNNILAKAFTKRKPEFIDEADNIISAYSQLLDAVPLLLVAKLKLWWADLFSIPARMLSDLSVLLAQFTGKLPPDEQTYLRIGKLTL